MTTKLAGLGSHYGSASAAGSKPARNIVVTVVICTFNRQDLLKDALESVTHMRMISGYEYKIIVIDDGSADCTQQVVRLQAAKSPVAIRYFRQDNAGVAAARNHGVRVASGDWIAFFDDDQVAAGDWLSKLIETAAASNADCVGGPIQLELPSGIDPISSRTVRALLGENLQMAEEKSTRWSRFDPRRSRNAMPGTGNVLIRAQLFKDIGPFSIDLRYGEDLDFFRRAAKHGARFAVSPKATVKHVIPSSRLSVSNLLHLAEIGGRSQAEVDTRVVGLNHTIWMALLRGLHLAIYVLPKLITSRLLHDRAGFLGSQCSCKFDSAYIVSILTHVRSRLFSGLPL